MCSFQTFSMVVKIDVMQPFCIKCHVDIHQDGHNLFFVNTWIAPIIISDRKWISITNSMTIEFFWSLSFGD
jgi:hypothetical protein